MTNSAAHTNSPAQTLTFSLPLAPTNATINASSGVLMWRPYIAQANSTNAFSVKVADSGSPVVSAAQSLTVYVNPIVLPMNSVVGYTNGMFRLSVAGAAGPGCVIQAATDLTSGAWTSVYTNTPRALPFMYTNSASTNAAQFFRVLLGP